MPRRKTIRGRLLPPSNTVAGVAAFAVCVKSFDISHVDRVVEVFLSFFSSSSVTSCVLVPYKLTWSGLLVKNITSWVKIIRTNVI